MVMKLLCPSNIYQESWLLLSITKLLGKILINKNYKVRYKK